VSGIAQVNDDATITISELPVRMWTRQFKEQLEVMRDPKDKKPDVTIQVYTLPYRWHNRTFQLIMYAHSFYRTSLTTALTVL